MLRLRDSFVLPISIITLRFGEPIFFLWVLPSFFGEEIAPALLPINFTFHPASLFLFFSPTPVLRKIVSLIYFVVLFFKIPLCVVRPCCSGLLGFCRLYTAL